VLERNPEAMNPVPLEGHVWLDTPGKVLHTDERHLEFTGLPARGVLPAKKIHLPYDADPKEGLKKAGTRSSRTP
jgi:hypothetical protein